MMPIEEGGESEGEVADKKKKKQKKGKTMLLSEIEFDQRRKIEKKRRASKQRE